MCANSVKSSGQQLAEDIEPLTYTAYTGSANPLLYNKDLPIERQRRPA